jgi:PAS domain S-box-containing protein
MGLPNTKMLTKTATIVKSYFSMLNLLGLFFITAIFITYSFSFFNPENLAIFNIYYADSIFICLILAVIYMQFKGSSSVVDPIYWILLASAFLSWFSIAILRLSVWDHLNPATKITLTNLGYFLYFSLTIAAIEVKNYTSASQLLTSQSLLIWISSLSFTLGSFILLVLVPSQDLPNASRLFSTDFLFYLLMDIYLCIRWFNLAWIRRKSDWLAYVLMGFGAINWGIAYFIESLEHANRLSLTPGTWTDWLGYSPFFFIFIALQLKQNSNPKRTASVSYNPSHLFNSPIFFILSSLITVSIINENDSLFVPLSLTQHTVLNLWLSINIGLAILQLLLLTGLLKQKNLSLKEAQFSAQAMQQQRHQQAQKLKAQAASNKAILDTTNNAIFTMTMEGKIISANPASYYLLGYPLEQLIETQFQDFILSGDELCRYFSYQSYRLKLAEQSKGIELESIILTSQGQLPVHVTLSQEQDSSDGILVVSLIDISEQKKAEEEAHDIQNQFTDNISHEFRTPLTIINGVVDKLLDDQQCQHRKEELLTAKRNGLRMIQMVEQLLELSRLANEPMPIEIFNAAPLVNFISTSFNDIAKANQIGYQYQTAENIWINGNQQAFEKVLFNLLSNAFKYTEKGQVSLTQKLSAEQYQLKVCDTGIGIDPEQQQLIFKRFHRVDSQQVQTTHGVGIGLALVKELCDALNWQLLLESTPGKGSTFTLTVEVTTATETLLADEATPTLSSMASSTVLMESLNSEMLDAQVKKEQQHKKSEYSVLIVEDNQDMQSQIKDILSPHHQCLLADNGEEGLSLATDYLPDIIISDVMMPLMNGFELLKRLKNNDMTTHIPVILLTAKSDSKSRIKGLEAEANDYLSKPFDANELRLRVHNQLISRQKLQQKLSLQWQQSPPDRPASQTVEDKFVLKLDDIFEHNHKNCDFSVQDLASLLAMSDRQVQRKIKALLNISPLEALKRYRLKQAKKQLASGDQIGIIAQNCGFSSQSYFGRCFKEQYAMTPKAYQQSSK